MKKLTTEGFIEKSNTIHHNIYDYNQTVYINGKTNVDIICPIHGIFNKKPSHHLRGQGCQKCSTERTANTQRLSLEDFIMKSNRVHDNRYTYEDSEYVCYNKKIIITCQKHGSFEQTPGNHLSGKGCKYCGGTIGLDTKLFILKSKQLFGDVFTYDRSTYVNACDKVIITCKEHGDFLKSPNNHLSKKQGCPKCLNYVNDTHSFIKKSNNMFKGGFSYEKTKYVSMNDECIITCITHGDMLITPRYHLNSDYGCKKCSNSQSKGELSLVEFIRGLNVEIIHNDRSILKNKEIDVLVPSLGIGVEFNGVYWHSDNFIEKDYHLNKTEECIDNNIKLVHIFSDEWEDKQEIVKSMLSHRLGVTERKIYARKCVIRNVSKKDKSGFFRENHIQGSVPTSIDLGVYYDNELVSMMSFGVRSVLKNSFTEVIRFCNKLNTSVVGSFGKLLQHYIKTYKPKKLISYCDRRWGEGLVYEKSGFTFVKNTIPGYTYHINKKRVSRYGYQKHKLVSMGFDKNKTEREIMLDMGYHRIYDCGNKLYEIVL